MPIDPIFKLAVETGNDRFLVALARKLAEKTEQSNPMLAFLLKRLAERLAAKPEGNDDGA